MSETSSIVLTGEILPERNFDEVVVALSQLLKTTEQKAAEFLSGKETVIKRNVPAAEVGKYLAALNRAGAGVRCEPAASAPAIVEKQTLPPASEAALPTASSNPAARSGQAGSLSLQPLVDEAVAAPPAAIAAPAAAVAETVSCPQCGHQQPKRTLCLQCGCDMPRMRAAQQQAKTEDRVSREAFQAPRAALLDRDDPDEVVTPSAFGLSLSGRIGRLRYLAYVWAMIVPVALAGIAAALVIPKVGTLGFVVVAVVVVAALWMGIRLAVLRLHDLNRTGKWILLMVLLSALGGATRTPSLMLFASVVLWLGSFALMVWPGSDGENDFGAPCGPNSTLIVVGAVLVIILQVVGVFGAVDTIRNNKDGFPGAMSGIGERKAKPLDFSNPVYAEIRIEQHASGRDLEMVYVGKMANEADCEQQSSSIKDSFVTGCKNCVLKTAQCKQQLSARYSMLFDDAPMSSATYLSMAAGDASEREARIVFWGLSVDESSQVCQSLKGWVQKTQKGAVKCVVAQAS